MISYLGGLSANVHNPVAHTFAEDLTRCRPVSCRKQVIAACGHKLLRIVYSVLTDREPFDPAHKPTKTAIGNPAPDADRDAGSSPANLRAAMPAASPRPAPEATASDVSGCVRDKDAPAAPGGNPALDGDPALGKARDAAHALLPRPGPEVPAGDAPGCICDVAVPVVPGMPPMWTYRKNHTTRLNW